jgi:small subunit ribosomal protein S17
VAQAEASAARPRHKTMVGRVVSDKMEKTVVVAVERITAHRLYKKRIRRTSKYKAHNPDNRARAGDWVRIVESRPLSKEKRWRVLEVLGPGGAPAAEGSGQ